VNVFHGRVEKGQAFWHGIPIDYPDYPHAQARPARVYLRPHELDIARTSIHAPNEPATNDSAGNSSLPASVLRIARSGPISRISCRPDGSESELHVDLPADTARDLALQPGERVTITPRKVRVFLPDPEYVI
jgi:sulfate transport system ATP-binding protein